MAATVRTLGGFRVLRLACSGPGVPFVRHLYLRERADAEAEGRTLHVSNLPPHCTEAFLNSLLGTAGRIISVAFESHVLPNDTAAVVFATPDALLSALMLCEQQEEQVAAATEELGDATGLALWLSEARARLARSRDPQAMAAEADEAVRAFVAQKHAANDAKEQAATTADEDGWTLVARRRGQGHKRSRAETRDGANLGVRAARPLSHGKLAAMQRTAQSERSTVLADFYRFNAREARDAQLDSLRRRFELDRQRVEKMKANRKFV